MEKDYVKESNFVDYEFVRGNSQFYENDLFDGVFDGTNFLKLNKYLTSDD